MMPALWALLILVGFVMMIYGADYFVRGASQLASRTGMPPLIIGVTIVAWGTSLPELAVALGASADGEPGLALGNVIGSNIANVLLIGGVAALLIPLCCPPKTLYRDALFLAAASILATSLGALGMLTWWLGAGMLGLLVLQTYFIYCSVTRGGSEDVELPEEADAGQAGWVPIAQFAGGLALVLAGSQVLIHNAVALAHWAQISPTVIGITMVAVGTSLPELSTSIAAAKRGERDIIIGNIIGSNIANITLVLGATALLTPTVIPSDLLDGDGWVMIATSGLFVGLILLGQNIGRVWGALFLAAYVVYVGWQFDFFGLMG